MKKRIYCLILAVLLSSAFARGAEYKSLFACIPIACVNEDQKFLVDYANFSVSIAAIWALSCLGYIHKHSLVKKFNSLKQTINTLLFGSPPAQKNKKRSSWGDNEDDGSDDFSERAENIRDLNEKIRKTTEQKHDGVTELHVACHHNDVEKVKQLLPTVTTKDLNAQYDYDRRFEYRPFAKTRQKTALIMACEKQNSAIVDLLLSREDIDPNITDHTGATALHHACNHGNLSLVQKLLNIENIDINKGYRTVLDMVYERIIQSNTQSGMLRFFKKEASYKAIFSLLLEQDTIDPTGALACACKHNDMKMFHQLLKHKNTPTCLKNNWALYAACKNGNLEMVKALLELNIDDCMGINKPVYNRFFYSSKICWDSCAQNYNPLHIACKRGSISSDQNYIEIIKLLLSDPFIDVNLKTSLRESQDKHHSFTVFHFAAVHPEMLELLLKQDSSFIDEAVYKFTGSPKTRWPWLYVSKKDKHLCYSTPLRVAIKAGNLSCIKLLVERGADIFRKDRGYDLFEFVCEKASQDVSYHEIVTYLIQYFQSDKEKINFTAGLALAIANNGLANQQTLELLLRYTHPNQPISQQLAISCGVSKDYTFSPLLKAAGKNLEVLNLFIDQYEGDCTPHNYQVDTILFKAFMAEKIDNFNQINYFNRLNQQQKQEHMQQELVHIAQSDPIIKAKIIDIWNRPTTKEKIEKSIRRLNLFVDKCIEYGLVEKAIVDKSLDDAYEKMKKVQHFRDESRSCSGSDRDCYSSWCCYGYREVIIHALLRHATDQRAEPQRTDQKIARAYKDKPMDYYIRSAYGKEQAREFFQKQA